MTWPVITALFLFLVGIVVFVASWFVEVETFYVLVICLPCVLGGIGGVAYQYGSTWKVQAVTAFSTLKGKAK